MKAVILNENKEFYKFYKDLRKLMKKKDDEVAQLAGFKNKNHLIWACSKKILTLDEINAILQAISNDLTAKIVGEKLVVEKK